MSRPERATRAVNRNCPNEAAHTAEPAGYAAWHEWAEEMRLTHVQQRCSGCDRYMIWTPKTPT